MKSTSKRLKKKKIRNIAEFLALEDASPLTVSTCSTEKEKQAETAETVNESDINLYVGDNNEQPRCSASDRTSVISQDQSSSPLTVSTCSTEKDKQAETAETVNESNTNFYVDEGEGMMGDNAKSIEELQLKCGRKRKLILKNGKRGKIESIRMVQMG